MNARKKPLKFFFYRGDLHKKIHINRGIDVITAWNFPKATLNKYVYTDVRNNGEKAFTTKQVAEMVNRKPLTIKKCITEGKIFRPQISYSIEDRNEGSFFWCEKDILALHEYLSSIHGGRPRADGRVTPKELPTASELRAMIRQGTVLYVRQGDKFVPTWRATNF
jgi:hypothetical protein